MLWGFFGLLSFAGVFITLVGFIVQLIRKRPNKKVWGITAMCLAAVFLVCLVFSPSSEELSPSYECEILQFEVDDNGGSPYFNAIVGVTNTGEVPIDLGYTTFEIDDSQGSLVALEDSSAVCAMPSIVYPGETGYYFGINIGLPERVSSDESYELIFETKYISAYSGECSASVYSAYDVSFPEGDYSEILGRIEGDSLATVDVLCICYDEQQNIVTMGGAIVELDEDGNGVFDIYNFGAYGKTNISTYEIIARKTPY